MKKVLLLLVVTYFTQGQSVTIDPSASSSNIINAKSTNQGILVPKMTTTQKGNISNKVEGMMVYDTDVQQFSYWTGSLWVNFGNATANSGWQANGQDVFTTGTGRVGIGATFGNTYGKLTVNADINTKTNAIFGSNGSGISLQKGPAAIGFNTYADANGSNNVRYMSDGYGLINKYETITGKISWNTLPSGVALGYAASETRMMTLKQDGKLGIGSHEPDNRLQIGPSNSMSNFDLAIGNDDGGGMSFIQFGPSGSTGLSRFLTNSKFSFTQFSTDNVNVGIGTTNPINHLQIGNNSSPAFSGNQIAAFNATGSGMSIALSGSPVTGVTNFYTNSKYSFMSYGGGNGNLGIGTSNPETKLVVKGGFSLPIKTITSNTYSVQDDDYTIVVNNPSDTVFVTFPTTNIEGRMIKIVGLINSYKHVYIGTAANPRLFSLWNYALGGTFYYVHNMTFQCLGNTTYNLQIQYSPPVFIPLHWVMIDSDHEGNY